MHWSKKYVIVGGGDCSPSPPAAPAPRSPPTGATRVGPPGPGADQAKAAALKIYPGSHANSVERDSENGATWEVEVAKPDGSTVDVRLDQNYKLVVAEADSEDQGGN